MTTPISERHMICERQLLGPTTVVARSAEPCPDCGHTALVHPGVYNPELRSCALCNMRILAIAPTALRPGDRVVIGLRPTITADQAQRLRDEWYTHHPDIPLTVVTADEMLIVRSRETPAE